LIATSHTVVGFGDTFDQAIEKAEQRACLFSHALSRVGADAHIAGVQTVVIDDQGVFHLITYTGFGIEEAMRLTEV